MPHWNGDDEHRDLAEATVVVGGNREKEEDEGKSPGECLHCRGGQRKRKKRREEAWPQSQERTRRRQCHGSQGGRCS